MDDSDESCHTSRSITLTTQHFIFSSIVALFESLFIVRNLRNLFTTFASALYDAKTYSTLVLRRELDKVRLFF